MISFINLVVQYDFYLIISLLFSGTIILIFQILWICSGILLKTSIAKYVVKNQKYEKLSSDLVVKLILLFPSKGSRIWDLLFTLSLFLLWEKYDNRVMIENAKMRYNFKTFKIKIWFYIVKSFVILYKVYNFHSIKNESHSQFGLVIEGNNLHIVIINYNFFGFRLKKICLYVVIIFNNSKNI